jgi:hypothetical protein
VKVTNMQHGVSGWALTNALADFHLTRADTALHGAAQAPHQQQHDIAIAGLAGAGASPSAANDKQLQTMKRG